MRNRIINCPECSCEINVSKEVKNHIHNTLGFNKESLQEIIETTINKEIKKIINTSFVSDISEEYIKDLIKCNVRGSNWNFNDEVRKMLSKEIGNAVFNKMNIDVSLRELVKEGE